MKDLLEQRHKEFEKENPHPGEKPADMSDAEWEEVMGGYEETRKALSFMDQTVLMVLEKAVKIINNEVPQPEEWLEWTNEERRRYLQGGRAVRVLLTSSIEELKANQ